MCGTHKPIVMHVQTCLRTHVPGLHTAPHQLFTTVPPLGCRVCPCRVLLHQGLPDVGGILRCQEHVAWGNLTGLTGTLHLCLRLPSVNHLLHTIAQHDTGSSTPSAVVDADGGTRRCDTYPDSYCRSCCCTLTFSRLRKVCCVWWSKGKDQLVLARQLQIAFYCKRPLASNQEALENPEA